MEVEKQKDGILIQKRDLEVLKFCLEMKFADIETLNECHFDAKSTEMFAARKRIQKLEAGGLLKSVSMLPGTAKKFYLATAKGHREYEKANITGTTINDVFQITPKPVTKLSQVTFEHDLGVLKARMVLERQGRATFWRSERLLKAQAEAATGRLSREFMPDGIFTSKQGKTCAFEFENKLKTDVQLKSKIYRLYALMNEANPIFQACLFITATEKVKQKVKKITDSWPENFFVQSVGELEGKI